MAAIMMTVTPAMPVSAANTLSATNITVLTTLLCRAPLCSLSGASSAPSSVSRRRTSSSRASSSAGKYRKVVRLLGDALRLSEDALLAEAFGPSMPWSDRICGGHISDLGREESPLSWWTASLSLARHI